MPPKLNFPGGTWLLARPQAKALHVIPDDLSDDGGTTFGAGNPFTFSGAIAAGTFDFQGVAAYEIAEVMGRIGLSGGNNSFSLIDNFSYTGAGTKGLRGGPGNFFSIDNGVTLLNDPTGYRCPILNSPPRVDRLGSRSFGQHYAASHDSKTEIPE